MIGSRVNAAAHGSYPSILLALSARRLYVLGRTTTGIVGGWKHLHPVTHIERSNVAVSRRRHGTVRVIELTDTSTGVSLEFEAQNIGDLGVNELLEALG